MTYRRALAALESRQETRIRLGLGRVRRHLSALGDPQESFLSIHVAGTNGKGAVCAMLASILREAGWNAGLYASPHLSDVRERIAVNGNNISPAVFSRFLERTLRRDPRKELTYFEILTSMAFQYFRDRRVEIAVLETGLGGRLDATNVVEEPLATIVTSIDYDHMGFLGSTLKAIAREKAGIFKRGAPALTAETKPEALRVLAKQARRAGSSFHVLPGRLPWRIERVDWKKSRQILRGPGRRRLELGLLGAPQLRNAALVLDAINELKWHGIAISDGAVARGLSRVRWPGRFEVLRRGRRTLIVDGAHNPAAVRRFCETLAASPWRKTKKLFIFGILKDKQHQAIVRLLAPHLQQVMVTCPPSPRALDAAELSREIARWAPKARVSVVSDPMEALRLWMRGRGEPTTACACGSFYLAGMARDYFKERI